jgi:hypothetical protein
VYRPNILGDLRAEADHAMLEAAFYESPDYKTLLEHREFCVVVGRRGVGKSALFYRLAKYWEKSHWPLLAQLAPEQHQVIGMRALLQQFGDKTNLIHAGSRIAWRYALVMEVVSRCWDRYKFKHFPGEDLLHTHLGLWRRGSDQFVERLRCRLRTFGKASDPQEAVADLPNKLDLQAVEVALRNGLNTSGEEVILLIDRLDEGYEPDPIGIGLLIGLVQAAVDMNSRFSSVKVILFLRDNIFRAIARFDPNYSRSVEGQVLRIHWDEYHLFNMTCNRIRTAFKLTAESNLDVWNAITAKDLKGRDGFRRCLKHTLYRPRDVLALLNQALHHAHKQNHRDHLIYEDVESVAKEISRSRKEDLIKEYDVIFPGIERFIQAFVGKEPEITYGEALETIEVPLYADDSPPHVQQHLAIINNPKDVIRSLHSIGFLGLQEPTSKSFVFCHDGKSEPIEPSPQTKVLVHPCYWMALDLSQQTIDQDRAAEIHDEYDIEVASDTPEHRSKRLGQIMGELQKIPEGDEGASAFENWCEQAVKIVFAGGLRNVELKPNKAATQRRDIVGTNHGDTSAWKRILEDYGSRQVVIEAKNYSALLGRDEYRQMLSYLNGCYGRAGFIVTRNSKMELEKGKELDWMREMYHVNEKRLIIKLTAKILHDWLSKLRSPQKHNAVDDALNGLVDRYERVYLSLEPSRRKKGK